MFLITGASGNIGRVVTAGLTQRGQAVRAISRRPPSTNGSRLVETVSADLQQEPTDATIFSNVDGVFLNSSATMQQTESFLAAAAQAGVKHVVIVSSVYVKDGLPAAKQTNAIAAMHRSMEELVERSGIAWTHLRAEEFATNTLFQVVPQIAHSVVVRGAYGDARSATIHERDIADSVVAVLLGGPDEHGMKVYTLTGPQTESERERVDILASITGRPLVFEEISPEAALSEMTSAYVPTPVAEAAIRELERRTINTPQVSGDVEHLTGRAPLTFAQWAMDHRAELSV